MDADGLRRMARSTGFDTAMLEKDYAFSWLLCCAYSSPLRGYLVFKGGTALRKIFFPEWRLSEDLDFTIARGIDPDDVREDFEDAFSRVKEIAFAFKSFSPGQQAIFADVQYMGPLGFKNRIAIDISLRERMVLEPVRRRVEPEYGEIPPFEVYVYAIEEILIEKIRSIIQRGKARDYYDVWRLLSGGSFDIDRIKGLLVDKCRITGVEYRPDLIFDGDRLSEAGRYWEVALSRLTRDLPDFGRVVDELRRVLKPLYSPGARRAR